MLISNFTCMIPNVGENISSGIILSGRYLDKRTPCAKITFCTRYVMCRTEKSVVLFLGIVSTVLLWLLLYSCTFLSFSCTVTDYCKRNDVLSTCMRFVMIATKIGQRRQVVHHMQLCRFGVLKKDRKFTLQNFATYCSDFVAIVLRFNVACCCCCSCFYCSYSCCGVGEFFLGMR
jgi:hypothetical protein